jgi:hypothetical protein
MSYAGEGDLLPGLQVFFKDSGRLEGGHVVVVSPEQKSGLGDWGFKESAALLGHVRLPGAEDFEDALERAAVTENTEVRPEVVEGDATGAGGLVVGPEDHAAGSEGDAEGEKASPASEVEGYDVGTVAGEGVRRREKNEAPDADLRHGGEPQSEGAPVGVADDDGFEEADALGELGYEEGQRVRAHVERAGERFGREQIQGDDAAVGGQALDELG